MPIAPRGGTASTGGRWSGPLSTGPTSAPLHRGGGTDDIPPVPRIDPSSALLRDPQVPERDRYCRHGGTPHPVGRSREGRPGLVRGFCPQDGTPYSFAPPLAQGSLVAGQYEVRGALAHGGLGWIYLAVDRNVDDRWVVLKGVLDANDPAALAAARAERQFLAQLSHPNIVAIHNFVRHVENDEMGREHTADYIVMAYIGGSTLAQVRDARADQGVLPVAHALTYMIKVLPALGYLHAEGHVYSDFKPDNVMQCERHLTLIDMGGRRPDRRRGRRSSTAPSATTPRRSFAPSSRRHRISTPSAAHSRCWRWASSPRGAGSRPSCPTTTRCCCGTSRCTGCCCAPRTLIRCTGSAPPTRWPSSSTACAGRCWPSTSSVRAPRRRRSSPLPAARSPRACCSPTPRPAPAGPQPP
jgi:serine/threonine protein kinase